MSAQEFSGTSVREVLTEVRNTLGADAIILEQRHVDDRVIVMAAAELEPIAEAAAAVATVAVSLPYQQQLQALGFDESFIQRLRIRVPTLRALVDDIVAGIPVLAKEHLPDRGGTWQFIGPPGAGKTSALIRVLTRWLATGGDPAQVRILSTDGDRLGGCGTLSAASELVGVAFQRCPNDELRGRIHALTTSSQPLSLTLIDRGSADVITPLPGTSTCLVLPSTLSLFAMRDELVRCGHLPNSLLITQVDRIPVWGAWMSFATGAQIPVSYLTSSNELPLSLEPLAEQQLRDSLIGQIERFATTTTFT